MNYYPSTSYIPMSRGVPVLAPPSHPSNVSNISTNRFIYIKHNFLNPNSIAATKVHVNPHFKKKVYVNPQFQPPPPKPKIHINPHVLKSLVPKPESRFVNDSKTTVISTRNKLVRIPCNSSQKVAKKRRNSLHTKYKIVRSSTVNKYKLDKRSSAKSVKKKYVYVNRFLSMDIVAKNVLFKRNSNLCKRGLVNINGILYRKSPNSLRKAYASKAARAKYKFVRRRPVRARSKAGSGLKKCNIPCPVYRKHGKCPGRAAGTCFKLHNPDQIVLCVRFLQGACRDENCLLSHRVSHEKMPTCKYFLEGMCSKEDCPYLHVKISPKAEICKNFLEGFCEKGAECEKRHQLLCPDFEKNKECLKRRCPYPHGDTVRKNKVSNILAKKCSPKKEVVKNTLEVFENNRYYKDSAKDYEEIVDSDGSVIKTVSRDRPRLGDLPVFIPFFDPL